MSLRIHVQKSPTCAYKWNPRLHQRVRVYFYRKSYTSQAGIQKKFWWNQARSQKRQQWHQSWNLSTPAHELMTKFMQAAMMWLFWRKICPERKHCDPDFLDDSFLSSKIDDPLDESFKVDDLEASDNDDESQDEENERISSWCKFIVFREMFSQLLIFRFKCWEAAHIEKTKVRGTLQEVTLMFVEGHQR